MQHIRDVTGKGISVDKFPNMVSFCDRFSPDCLKRVDVPLEAKYYDLKFSYTETKPPVEGKKGDTMGPSEIEIGMRAIVRKVYAKDSLETAELVNNEMTDNDLGQGFMAELALTEKKDVVLKEAKRRKKEREEREK